MLPIFLMIDVVWLGMVMNGFYSQKIGEVARRAGVGVAPRWAAAALVYILIPGGIILFVQPNLGSQVSVWKAFGWGAIFGLVTYGIYDLTNRAILEKWSLRMTIVDILRGCVICGTTSVVVRFVDRWLTK